MQLESDKIKQQRWISPTTKSKLRVLITTAESSGKLVKIELENQANDIGPPEHYHPDREETFHVIEGRLALRVGGKEFELGPGESATASKFVAHTFWNPGQRVVRFTTTHAPAGNFESFITSLYDLDYDGQTNAQGAPDILQLMALFKARKGEQFLKASPAFLQRIGMNVLGGVAGLLAKPTTYVSQRRETGLPPLSFNHESL